MDPLLAAERLPKLAERAMRAAVAAAAGRRTAARALIDDALIRFERDVAQTAAAGIRPGLLFAERDRIVRELRAFLQTRLAVRLFALRPRDVVAAGLAAAPFDAIVRGRDGAAYAVTLRRCRPGATHLTALRATRAAALRWSTPLRGVLIYDLAGSSLRTLRLDESAAQGKHRDLRARPQVQLRENVGDVVLDGLVAQLEPLTDLLVGKSLDDQTNDLNLALRKTLPKIGPGGRDGTKTARRRTPREQRRGDFADGEAAQLEKVRISA